jgi:hypothetical protein
VFCDEKETDTEVLFIPRSAASLPALILNRLFFFADWYYPKDNGNEGLK